MQATPLTSEQQATLSDWRALALEKMPYMSRVLFRLSPLNAPGLGTFAVDDRWRLYIDFEAVAGWSLPLCAEALLHEASHVLAEHSATADELGVEPADRALMNAAADLSINDDLRDAGCERLFSEIGALLPATYGLDDYLTPHEYLDALRRKREDQKDDSADAADESGSGDQSSGDGSGQDRDDEQNGSGDGSDTDQAASDDEGAAGSGANGSNVQPSEPFAGCGSGGGGMAAPCELDPDDDLDGQAPGTDAATADVVARQVARDIIEHETKMRGSVPGGMLRDATERLRPSRTPWEQLLASIVGRSIASRIGDFDTDPSRRDRRSHAATMRSADGTIRKIIVPGEFEPEPRVEVIRDTSGSMSAADLMQVGDEIDAICRRIGINGRDLMVTDVDSAAHEPVPYSSARSIGQLRGGGGTDMCVGIAAAVDRPQRPSVIIVMTDGYTPWPHEPVGIPVIAVIIAPDYASADAACTLASVPEWIKTVAVSISGE